MHARMPSTQQPLRVPQSQRSSREINASVEIRGAEEQPLRGVDCLLAMPDLAAWILANMHAVTYKSEYAHTHPLTHPPLMPLTHTSTAEWAESIRGRGGLESAHK